MSDPFHSALVKLGRAKDYVQAAQEAFNSSVERKRYRLAAECHRQRGGVLKIDVMVTDVQPLPAEIPLLIGDAAHNARSALDHLMFVLAKPKNSGEEERVQFPIYDTIGKFRSGWRNRMPGVKRGVPTAIERLQPYHSRKLPRSVYLWYLQKINNWDKHRALPVSYVALQNSELNLSFGADSGLIEEKGKVFQTEFKSGAVIASIYTKDAAFGAKMNMHAKLGFAPALYIPALRKRRSKPPKIVTLQPVQALTGACDYIEAEVIPRLRRFL